MIYTACGGLQTPVGDGDSASEPVVTNYFHFHSARVDSPFHRATNQSDPLMSESTTVKIEDEMDRWRYVCPREHRSWEPTNHHFWCAKCARRDHVDGMFHQLRDRKTGTLYERDQVRLLTPVGPYDQDLDRTEGSA